MNFIRFTLKSDSKYEMKGILEDNNRVRRIYGSYLQIYTTTDNIYDTADIELLPPVLPRNILCIGDSVDKSYVKAPSSLIGSGAMLNIPEGNDIYCIPRLAFVVKDRNHNKTTGINFFGTTLMLDFSYSHHGGGLSASYDKFTVLGSFLSDTVCDFEIADKMQTLAKNTSLMQGDIVALDINSGMGLCNTNKIVFEHNLNKIEAFLR